MGVPVAGGFKREDLIHDPRNERTRCSVWVQSDETSLVIDTGPEFRIQSIRAGIKNIDYVLITHEHMDHIGGLDDLRMYNYIKEGAIPVYTTESAIQSLYKRFDYLFGENKYPGSTSLELNEITSEIQLNDLKITPLPVSHGELEILGFRINNLSYLTDVKDIPKSTLELIRGSKIVVLSALRWEPDHPTHLTIPEAVDIINELDVPEAYLIHMNSYVDHSETNKKLPSHIRLAYDSLTIETG
jgi:phosphoribosyl 1,2-cyclic phosphate phosphodiesterase